MNVNLKQLQAFILVARLGSFTKAAQSMHLTQSALSLLVKELEAALNAKLIDRTTRSLELTVVGKEFLHSAIRLLDDLDHAIGNVHKWVNHEKGRVVIAAPLVLSGSLLPPILTAFNAQHPGIEIIIHDTLPNEVLPQVQSGAADLGMGTFHDDLPDMAQLPLFDEELVCIFQRRHPLARTRTLSWQAVSAYPLIAQTKGSVFRDLADLGAQAAQVQLKPSWELTYVGTIMGMVKAGLGIGIIPKYAVALLPSDELAWKPIESPRVHRTVTLIYRNAQTLSPAAALFMEHTHRHCEPEREARKTTQT
ncbi:MAG: LysR family transcriptional regulator [Pigmentiphaga sp.]|nr:LysR family transcriptional regulator [Pigmentiphaga sp.]